MEQEIISNHRLSNLNHLNEYTSFELHILERNLSKRETNVI